MESLIRIGAEVSKETSKNLGDLIDRVFSSAAKNRMEQATVHAALMLVERGLTVNNTTITGCTLVGEKTVS